MGGTDSPLDALRIEGVSDCEESVIIIVTIINYGIGTTIVTLGNV